MALFSSQLECVIKAFSMRSDKAERSPPIMLISRGSHYRHTNRPKESAGIAYLKPFLLSSFFENNLKKYSDFLLAWDVNIFQEISF
jgi:hypothetical protein